jgi:phosphatidylinositol dimannoside acyltransferase
MLPGTNMAIDARKIINTPLGLNLAYLLGNFTPYWLGYRIAGFIARRISSRKKWKLVQTTRCNQWVVNGRSVENVVLDKLVAESFQNIAISIFDFYHTINNPTASLRLIEPNPFAMQFVRRPKFSDRGMVLAGIHMSNFDMAFQMGGLAGVKALSLTIQEFNAAYQKQYEMRLKSGMNVVPASFGSIKLAIEHLRAGGTVITAIDRPDENSSYRPNFFGLPAALPVHYTFLALKAHVPVVVVALQKKPDGKYHFSFSDPIEMQPHPDRHQEIILNAENILRVAEGYIRQNPTQWSMTFPVWPEAMDQVPE